MGAKPTVIAMYFDRPYVVPELAKEAAALVAHFGVTDEALLDVLTGVVAPTGKLPFECRRRWTPSARRRKTCRTTRRTRCSRSVTGSRTRLARRDGRQS